MPQNKTIKLFLGASITELHDERVILSDYLMNSVHPLFKQDSIDIEVFKPEDFLSGNTGDSYQSEIDKHIRECDVSVFMFKSKAGEMTVHEFEMARTLQKRKQHEIFVYCFDVPEEDKSRDLKVFQNRLIEENIYWSTCKDIADLESKLIIGLIRYERQLLGKPAVIEANQSAMEMDDDSFFAEYQRKENIQAPLREKMHQRIDEELLQIETIMSNKGNSIDSRIFMVIELYKKADRWASATDYNKEKHSQLLSSYASFLSDHGLYNEAEAIYLRQIDLVEELYGKEHKNIADSFNSIGEVYRKQGKYDKALEYFLRALEIRQRILDSDHPDIATSLSNIGTVYSTQGDNEKALEYYQKALEIRKKSLGMEHSDTAISYNNIGLAYFGQHDFSKALEYHLKALEIWEKLLGMEHPSIAISYNNIGLVYSSLGNNEEALEYFEKALAIQKKTLGALHPNAADTYNNIGLVHYNLDNYDKAMEYFDKALAIREKVLGTEHPDTADSYNNIGWVLWKQGNYSKALEYHHKAFAVFEKYQKDYEHETHTLTLLLKHIQNYIDENNAKYVIDYYYTPNGKDFHVRIKCDLALLDSKDKLLRVYEICTFAAYESNSNFIQKELEQKKEATGVEVFLAYTIIKDDLMVLSLPEIEAINKERKKSESEKVETINSFSEYYALIKRICGNRVQDQQYFFRGQPDKQYPPLPSIYRKGRIEKESYLYHEAIRRNPTEFTEVMSTFDNLVKMQHYELPTRLLDITTNPLVALFFACQKDFHADGEVLLYSVLRDSQIKYFDSDSVCILANLAKRPINFQYGKHKSYLVYDIKKDRPIFDGKILKSAAIHDVLCVLPKLNNSRIIKQDGAFFIFGMGKDKKTPAEFLDSPTTIIVKANAKKGILNELELLGINEASLFPETDKVMHQIREEFCES